ncbi:hypothetical protein [Oceanospirillum sediminis]|uniref:Uncharacterized protein n=1 Tax=Oceanospirillum sediminis TaxID=2760088 RepID=A0A839IRF3_9GAMM|nr:hypothetical protein [Oceanospirillum sediminis]MBB1487518.1 hypothetical protein [Oceanospirillum sediminis]
MLVNKAFILKSVEACLVWGFGRFGLSSYPGDNLLRWREASNNALRHYAGKDLMSRRIIDQKKQFKVRYDNYYQWFGLYDK